MRKKQQNTNSQKRSSSRFGSSSSKPRSNSSSKPSQKRSGGRPFFRGKSNQTHKKSFKGENIEHARFINKATITEEMERFIPEHDFTDFIIEENLKKKITERGYTQPTPIQDRAIPHVLKGQDIVGIANTGTGKTAAFLIPLIDKVLKNRKSKILVVVPTRELALQIQDELRGLTNGLKIFSVCCVGGAPIGKQLSALRNTNEFVIGTPGRLVDLIKRKSIILNQFDTIVLDEADKMLEMGFVQDMRFLVAGMPTQKHTLFFAATFSPEIERLVGEFLNEPVRISVKTRDTSKNVEQDIVRVARGLNKIDVLKELLQRENFSKVLIFGRTKRGVEKLSKTLIDKGFKAESIHGDKTQSQRQKALKGFKDNAVHILVATDVAARGIDIPDVTHVINFDLPANYDDYVHRIGRTGRANKKGIALTFVE